MKLGDDERFNLSLINEFYDSNDRFIPYCIKKARLKEERHRVIMSVVLSDIRTIYEKRIVNEVE